MKNIKLFCVIFILLYSIGLKAQTPEKIPPYVQKAYEADWYKTQKELWYKEIKRNNKNEEAWMNYALAYRYYLMQTIGNDNWEPFNKANMEVMAEMKKYIPNSFTYNIMMANNMGCWDKTSMPYAEKAYQLRPEHPKAHRELIVRYELERNFEKRKEISTRLFNSNDVSPDLMNYNYNVLASLKPNAILFTVGDNDTYPLWTLQDVLGFRTDVIVVNIHLVALDEYRERLLKHGGVQLPEEQWKKLTVGPEATGQPREDMEKNIVATLSEYSGRPVYVGLTAGDDCHLVSQIKDKLYITGLASLYSKERIDNIALLKKNYEKEFHIDYLQRKFYVDDWQTIVNLTNQNYIVPFRILYKHYVLSGETEKAEKIKTIILKIARENNREAEVLKMLNAE